MRPAAIPSNFAFAPSTSSLTFASRAAACSSRRCRSASSRAFFSASRAAWAASSRRRRAVWSISFLLRPLMMPLFFCTVSTSFELLIVS